MVGICNSFFEECKLCKVSFVEFIFNQVYLWRICFYSFQIQSLVSHYISCSAEVPAENILIHQPTQAQWLESTMVIPKGEQLCPAVTPENIIGDDDMHEADFQILDSSDVQLSSSNSPDSISTKVETHILWIWWKQIALHWDLGSDGGGINIKIKKEISMHWDLGSDGGLKESGMIWGSSLLGAG